MIRKKGDYVCNHCCLCYEYRVFGYRPLSKPGLFLWKKALKHSKDYFVSGNLKQDKVPEKVFFHTLDLEKAFSFRGLGPLTPIGSRRRPLDFQLFDFPPIPISENGFRYEWKRARVRSYHPDLFNTVV